MKGTHKQIITTLILRSIQAVFATGVFAQSNTGTISGMVQDQGGGTIPNATVTVTNVGTNETRTTQSNDEGFYEVPSLANGVYRVVATAIVTLAETPATGILRSTRSLAPTARLASLTVVS